MNPAVTLAAGGLPLGLRLGRGDRAAPGPRLVGRQLLPGLGATGCRRSASCLSQVLARASPGQPGNTPWTASKGPPWELSLSCRCHVALAPRTPRRGRSPSSPGRGLIFSITFHRPLWGRSPRHWGSVVTPSCFPSERPPEAGCAARGPATDEVEGVGGTWPWLPGTGEAHGR